MRADNKIFIGFVVAVITGLAGAIAKVMHWPYGPELLLGGQSLGWTLVIIWYMRKVRQKKARGIRRCPEGDLEKILEYSFRNRRIRNSCRSNF